MLKNVLTSVKDFILEYNTYFDTGFAHVIRNEEGYLVEGETPVFPSDIYGDYFYMRLPDESKFDYAVPRLNDCDGGFKQAANIVLVACMVNADEYELANNLISTLNAYKDADIKLTNIVYDADFVVKTELSKRPDPEASKGMQNIDKNYKIISIAFDLKYYYEPIALDCIERPECNC